MASPPLPGRALRPDFRFLDVEASAFLGGFPLEVGWSDDSLVGDGFLIRPHSGWGWCSWSPESEAVHGISRREAEVEGVDVVEAARRLNAAFRDATLVMSDEPGYDGGWIEMVFLAAGVDREFEVLSDGLAIPCHAAIKEPDREGWVLRLERARAVAEGAFPRPHRAVPDATWVAAAFRMAVDRDYLAVVEAWTATRRAGSQGPASSVASSSSSEARDRRVSSATR